MKTIPKGHIFSGPNGIGYIATRDINPGDYIAATDLEPFGGAEAPVEHAFVPEWLLVQFQGDAMEVGGDYIYNPIISGLLFSLFTYAMFAVGYMIAWAILYFSGA